MQNPGNPLPTPPESMATVYPNNMATPSSGSSTMTPPSVSSTSALTPTLPQASPAMSYTSQMPNGPPQPQPLQRGPTFAVSPANQQPSVPQRPLPAVDGIADWFSPPAPFISPHAFNSMNGGANGFFGDPSQSSIFAGVPGASMGYPLGQFAFSPYGPQMNYSTDRQNSLSQEQQMELMNSLETEGLNEIDAFLNMGAADGSAGARW